MRRWWGPKTSILPLNTSQRRPIIPLTSEERSQEVAGRRPLRTKAAGRPTKQLKGIISMSSRDKCGTSDPLATLHRGVTKSSTNDSVSSIFAMALTNLIATAKSGGLDLEDPTLKTLCHFAVSIRTTTIGLHDSSTQGTSLLLLGRQKETLNTGKTYKRAGMSSVVKTATISSTFKMVCSLATAQRRQTEARAPQLAPETTEDSEP